MHPVCLTILDICWSGVSVEDDSWHEPFHRCCCHTALQLAHYHNLLRKWKCGVPKSSTPWPPATSHSLLLFTQRGTLGQSQTEESNIWNASNLSSPPHAMFRTNLSPVPICVRLFQSKHTDIMLHVFFFLLYTWYVLLHYKGEWCHNTVGLLSVTYSISALIVSQQTYDVSCLGAFAEKGVFGLLLTSISLLSCLFDTSLWPSFFLYCSLSSSGIKSELPLFLPAIFFLTAA